MIKIYNAFAGTGKTYLLINKFIITSIKNYKKYNFILSFTNYSINNIKNKILKKLFNIINNKKNIYKKINIKKKKINKICLNIIYKILTKKNILTIDKFFYSLIKTKIKIIKKKKKT